MLLQFTFKTYIKRLALRMPITKITFVDARFYMANKGIVEKSYATVKSALFRNLIPRKGKSPYIMQLCIV